MENGNINTPKDISPESFEVDLDALDAQQVGSEETPGSTEGEQPLQVEVDPKYAGLPEAEGIARTIQSKYDLLNIDYIQAQKDVQTNLGYKEILSDLYESDDAFYAFLNERKPELINTRDVKGEITKHITEKFGEGFQPELSRDESEQKDPGGKDWLYYQELDKVRNSLNTNSYSKHQSLKEFREARQSDIAKENALIEAEITEVTTKLKMSQTEVDWNRKWSTTLKFGDLVRISRFLRKFQNAPAMANIPGDTNIPAISKSRKDFQDSIRS